MALLHQSVAEDAPEALPGEMRITLTNSVQGRHLHHALRGHCEVDFLPGCDGAAVVVSNVDSGSCPVLRRVNDWMTEFGVQTISLQLNGHTYEMKRRRSGDARIAASAVQLRSIKD